MAETDLTFIQNPTPERLQEAAATNHQHWMRCMAEVSGGDVHQDKGAMWIYTPAAMGAEVTIAFPRLAPVEASDHLDAILAACRGQSLRQVACWSLLPAQPPDLGARLVARGFQWGWQPHWMWLDFAAIQPVRPDQGRPAGLRVDLVDDATGWVVDDLPYYDREIATNLGRMSRLQPRRVWHFAAWLEGQLVGQSVLHLTTGPLGVAGIYSCGVVPAARRQGVGKAVTLAACQFAQTMGCPGAILNATEIGTPMYRRLGFESVGHGQTWWLFQEQLAEPPPPQQQVALAEAVGCGDIETLTALGKGISGKALDAPLAGGMTLMQLAVRMDQPVSAEWLATQGATLDLISAWDLGWQDRVPQLLAKNPGLANARFGRDPMTPLHVAAMRNDLNLARTILAANPDLSLDNGQIWHDAGTPLHQAAWFGHLEMVELLLEHHPPLEATNGYGGTPLRTAVYGSLHGPNRRGNYAAVVERLLAAGASVPAMASGTEAVAAILVKHGAAKNDQ